MFRSSLLWVVVLSTAVIVLGCGGDFGLTLPMSDDGAGGDSNTDNTHGPGTSNESGDSSDGTDSPSQPQPDPIAEPLPVVNEDDDVDSDDDLADDDTIIPDYEYPSLLCALPDPENLGAGKMFGGGPAGGGVTVYIFDDETCAPIVNAVAKYNYQSFYTDVKGRTVLTGVPAGATITASKADYWAWGYQVDAAVMYFRLRPEYYYQDYFDSEAGHFTANGENLGLTNPQNVGEALSNLMYIGLAMPGMGRDAIFATRKYFAVNSEFVLNLQNQEYTMEVYFPDNFYLPDLDLMLTIPGYGDLGMWGVNEEYALPLRPGTPAMSLQGVIAGVEVGNVVNMENLIAVVEQILDGGDLLDILLPLVKPLLNDAITFPYVGAVPEWIIGGPPDIPVSEVGGNGEELPVSISNAAAGFDYVELFGAEIFNRTILPFGIATFEGQPAAMPYVEIPDADYLAVAAKTDLLASDFTSSRLSAAAQYADNVGDWAGGVTFDDADFLPFFDPAASHYDTVTGELAWEMEGEGADRIDAFWVVVMPWWSSAPEMVMFTLPGDARSLNLYNQVTGFDPCEWDSIIILALDLPFDYGEGFDPSRILSYNIPALSLWSYPDAASIFSELFGG
jgi:hypothetical protein